MSTTLHALLMLQEIDALLDDLEEATNREREAALGFTLGSTKKLRAERDRLARDVSPEAFDRFEQVRRRHRRAVAPVRRGVCLGCFTVRPTKSSIPDRLDTCERCGRILFPAEEGPQPPLPPKRSIRARPKASGRRRQSA